MLIHHSQPDSRPRNNRLSYKCHIKVAQKSTIIVTAVHTAAANILKPPTMKCLYLKYDGLVVFTQVECKDIGVHQGLSALTQYVDGFLQKLHLNPRHVV